MDYHTASIYHEILLVIKEKFLCLVDEVTLDESVSLTKKKRKIMKPYYSQYSFPELFTMLKNYKLRELCDHNQIFACNLQKNYMCKCVIPYFRKKNIIYILYFLALRSTN